MHNYFEMKTDFKTEETMKKIVFALALVAAMLVCSAASISAWEGDRFRFHFRTVFFPGDTFTQLLGINNSDVIAGYHGANVNKGFTLVLRGLTFTNENFPNSAQTQVIGINNSSETDGFYIDTAGLTHGFKDVRGTFLTVDFPNRPFNQLLGLNDFGQAAGYYSTTANGNGPDTA